MKIKPNTGSGTIYESILRTLRQDMDIETIGVDSIQRTKKGNLRIRMREKETGAYKNFEEKVDDLLGNAAATTKMRPKGK